MITHVPYIANTATDDCIQSHPDRFMGPIWGQSGAARTQVGSMLVPWTLLSGQCMARAIPQYSSHGAGRLTLWQWTDNYGRVIMSHGVLWNKYMLSKRIGRFNGHNLHQYSWRPARKMLCYTIYHHAFCVDYGQVSFTWQWTDNYGRVIMSHGVLWNKYMLSKRIGRFNGHNLHQYSWRPARKMLCYTIYHHAFCVDCGQVSFTC